MAGPARGDNTLTPCNTKKSRAVGLPLCEGGSGPVELVFVHGIRNAAWVWQPVLDRLDPDQFRWLAFDLPGCGNSDTPPGWEGCTVQGNAALLVGIVDSCCT